MGKYGTNLTGFGAYEGGVNIDKGAPIVSTSSDGSSAIIFGSVALREMEAGVANGDFQIPPDAASSNINSDNPLPYFTTSDSSSGRITLALTDSTAAPGTNLLRYTITSGVNADSFYVERIVPIVSSEARSFNYQAHAAIAAATSSANYTFTIAAQYLQSDGTTVTGTEGSLAKTGADISTTIASLGFSYEMAADPHGGAPAPADAYYLRLRYTISLTASVSSATFDLTELRVDHGLQNLMFADQASPDTYGYGQIALYAGGLSIEPNAIGANRSNPTLILDSISGDTQIDSSIRTGGSVTITNIAQDGLSTTFTGANPFQVSEVVPISGVTPSYFNSTGGVTIASRTSTTFTTSSYTPAVTRAIGSVNVRTNYSFGTVALNGSFSGVDLTNFASGTNVSYTVSGVPTAKVSKGTVANITSTIIRTSGWSRCWTITSATYISLTSMKITAPGHNITTADKIWVTTGSYSGGGDPNIVGATGATVTAVSGNDITYTWSGSAPGGDFTKNPSFDWSVWAIPATSSGDLYKNTPYTSGGSAVAQYPLSGNIELIHSGSGDKSVIIKSGFLSGAPATTANLRFLSSTGPRIQGGGTNARLMSTSGYDLAASNTSILSGVLVTKAVAGQPSTVINGTATTDAFADALRNGGIAVDTSNNRGYFYSAGWKYAALTTPSDSRLKEEITAISGALDTLRQLVPVAFKWKRPEAHGRSEAVDDDGKRLGFIADQVATTDLKHWVETLGVDEREVDLVDTEDVLAVNIPQNEMEALVVQALLDIDTRLKALESR